MMQKSKSMRCRLVAMKIQCFLAATSTLSRAIPCLNRWLVSPTARSVASIRYPSHVAALQSPHFATLMGTLEFGLLHTDGGVVQSALEGLAALGKFHYEGIRGGGGGLGGHRLASGEGVAAHFQGVLLRRLLSEDVPQEQVRRPCLPTCFWLLVTDRSSACLQSDTHG